jgi:hypothetical protein
VAWAAAKWTTKPFVGSLTDQISSEAGSPQPRFFVSKRAANSAPFDSADALSSFILANGKYYCQTGLMKKVIPSSIFGVLLIFFAGCSNKTKEASGPARIDLSRHYTASLTDTLNSPTSVEQNNLAELPKGRQVFSGAAFEVGGVVQLSGKKLLEWGRKEFPEAVKGIRVGRKVARIHALHGAGGVYDRDGVTIARLVVHYADNSVREFEIKTGDHVRDWWGNPKQRVYSPNSELAWSGSNPAIKKYGGTNPGSLRVYKTTFENDQPDLAITAMDYVSAMQNSSPFLVALSVE